MPSRWEIPLSGVEPGEVRWEHLHAAVSRWFDDDSEHHDKVKGWSLTPPRDGPDGPVIEIGLVRDDLLPRLLDHAGRGSRIRLGHTVIRTGADAQPIAATGWDELGGEHQDRAWSLRLLTPMTFRRGNRFTPLPAPTPILGSLRRSWNTWAPADQAIDLDLSSEPVWVTDLDGHNEIVKVNNRTVSGFLGRVRIETDVDGVAAAVGRLINLAAYSGVGAYTTRCFGVARPDPTWQPRWAP